MIIALHTETAREQAIIIITDIPTAGYRAVKGY